MIAALAGDILHRKTAGDDFAGGGPDGRQEGLVGIGSVIEGGEGLAVDGDGMLIGRVAHLRGQAH
jgi:hypothetical protein